MFDIACLSASMSSLSFRVVPSLAASDWPSAAAAAAAAEAGLVAEKREPDTRLRFCRKKILSLTSDIGIFDSLVTYYRS